MCFFRLTRCFFSLQRFEKDDMYRLLDALDIPENYICCQRKNAPGMEALIFCDGLPTQIDGVILFPCLGGQHLSSV